MMGQAVGQQDRLFFNFDLDERMPANRLLRRIDAVLDGRQRDRGRRQPLSAGRG